MQIHTDSGISNHHLFLILLHHLQDHPCLRLFHLHLDHHGHLHRRHHHDHHLFRRHDHLLVHHQMAESFSGLTEHLSYYLGNLCLKEKLHLNKTSTKIFLWQTQQTLSWIKKLLGKARRERTDTNWFKRNKAIIYWIFKVNSFFALIKKINLHLKTLTV